MLTFYSVKARQMFQVTKSIKISFCKAKGRKEKLFCTIPQFFFTASKLYPCTHIYFTEINEVY